MTVTLFLGCLVAAVRVDAQQGMPASEAFPAELDRYIANVLSQWKIPGLAIAVVRNDSTLVAKGYGVRRLGRPEPFDENTVFDVASLGKSFTTAAAAVSSIAECFAGTIPCAATYRISCCRTIR
jgi:CubicO group peptidase (beta-lactamase class C family)